MELDRALPVETEVCDIEPRSLREELIDYDVNRIRLVECQGVPRLEGRSVVRNMGDAGVDVVNPLLEVAGIG